MNKKFAATLVFALALAVGSNVAHSAPEAAVKGAKTLPAKMEKPTKEQMEQRKAEWNKLTPEQKEAKKKEMQARHDKMQSDFDAKIGLSDEQKAKAREIRERGREQMKPIMDKMDLKRKEIEKVRLSRISHEAQQKKIKAIREQMKPLKEKADAIRKANMQEFEAILTPEQKAKFDQMKKEAPKGGKGKGKGGKKGPRGGKFCPPESCPQLKKAPADKK